MLLSKAPNIVCIHVSMGGPSENQTPNPGSVNAMLYPLRSPFSLFKCQPLCAPSPHLGVQLINSILSNSISTRFILISIASTHLDNMFH